MESMKGGRFGARLFLCAVVWLGHGLGAASARRRAHGVAVIFEQVRGRRVTSGIGNCSPHYEKVKPLVLNAIRRFAPGSDFPTEDDWRRYEPENYTPQ